MARLWSSGQELNSTTASIEGIASYSIAVDATTFRSGTYGIRATGGVKIVQAVYRAANTAEDVYLRFYIYIATSTSALARIAAFRASGAAYKAGIRLNADNTLELWNEEDGAQVGSDSSALTGNTWYRIELRVNSTTVSSTTIDARINGSSFASGTINITDGPLEFVLGCVTAVTEDLYYDDIAINDSSGSFQNSWPGAAGIVHLKPNAAGDNEDWNEGTTAAPNTYQDVDEVTPDDATTVIKESTSTGELSDFNLEATPAAIGSGDTINVVAVGVRFNGTAAGTQAFALRIKASSGGTTEESANIVGNSATYMTNANAVPRNYALTLYDLPGASTTAWTKADLDTAQIGVNHTIDNGTNAINVSTLWLLVDFTVAAVGGEKEWPNFMQRGFMNPTFGE